MIDIMICEKDLPCLPTRYSLRHKADMNNQTGLGHLEENLILTEADKIGEGAGRKVYAYPGRPEWIIKLHKPFRKKRFHVLRRKLRYMGRRFGRYRHSMFEAEEYAAMVARTDRIPDFVPGYRGLIWVEGQVGAVFDAVRQADGPISPTLRNFLKAEGYSPALEAAINHLWEQVITFRCVVSDPNLSNALVQRREDGSLRLWLVDGLGERTVIPIMGMSDWVFMRNTRRNQITMIAKAKRVKA